MLFVCLNGFNKCSEGLWTVSNLVVEINQCIKRQKTNLNTTITTDAVDALGIQTNHQPTCSLIINTEQGKCPNSVTQLQSSDHFHLPDLHCLYCIS